MKSYFKKLIVAILFFEAKLILKKYKPKIIAVTGSVGKTSSKDAIFAVLSQFYFVRKSEKSFNSDIGIPLTILGVPNGWNSITVWIQNILRGLWLIIAHVDYPKWLVLETGIGKPGDMKKIASLIYSDIAIFTKISDTPVHVEFFISPEHVLEEKAHLIKTLKKNGTLLVNGDDPKLLTLAEESKVRKMTFGTNEQSSVYVSNHQIEYDQKSFTPLGVTFRVNYEGNSIPVVIEGVFGTNHVNAALVALSVSHILNLNMITATEALRRYDFPAGRMRLLSGVKESFIIDDTYNSSPVACESALKTLSEIKTTGRKIAVLGDMLELGRFTEEAHKKIGEEVAGIADILIAVGKRAQYFIEGARKMKMNDDKIFFFETSDEAKKEIELLIEKGDIVLVKGSQGVRMEKIVEEIMAHPELKDKLLVRQEKEWKNR